VKQVTVFVEGATAGKGKNESCNIQARKAFRKLSEKLEIKNSPRFALCGGRTSTYEKAWERWTSRDRGECVLLLVDSEELLSAPNNHVQFAWRHLVERTDDRWSMLTETNKNHVFLMVTTMETWLLADPTAIQKTFGSNAKVHQIPNWPNYEAVAKHAAFDQLVAMTGGCNKQYAKGQIAFELLENVDPWLVAAKCPHAKFFFERLIDECK